MVTVVKNKEIENVGKECTVNAREGFSPKRFFVGDIQNFSGEESVTEINKK